MLAIVSLLCVACAVIHQTATAPTAAEDRQRFLELYANQPGFGYLKRIAHQAERKKAVQRKKTNVARESPELLKRVQELQAHGVNSAHKPDSIQHENEPLSDFLYQGDLVLPEPLAMALNFTKGLKQHRAGGTKVVSGVTVAINKWPHDSPICYRFKEGSDPRTVEVAREAFKFWTENSCLRWEENCVSKPTIVITTDTRGCNTSPGRQVKTYSTTKKADGTVAKVTPNFADEQPLSLSAPGCTFFATAAHESSHVMGMLHEQSRLDRDNYIDVVWSSIAEGWVKQYDKQEGSETYGIAYDYGSNMQYTGYANDPKIDMAAKEKIFQHTMGNKYGPIFNDLKFLNTYNDCMCKSGIKCENQGFPHPLHCDAKCMCPEGFGGATCAERQAGENGAPAGCGATLSATSEWQSVVVSVDKPQLPATQPQVSLRQDCCTWWIKGNGKRVEIQLESVTPGTAGGCRNDCTFGGTEVKFGDLTRGGARVCCAEHAKEFGTVTTTTEMAIIRVCSMRTSYTTTVKFRTTG